MLDLKRIKHSLSYLILLLIMTGCNEGNQADMTKSKDKNSVIKTKNEPMFMAIPKNDPGLQDAYSKASKTIDEFITLLKVKDSSCYNAKLRFRDPDESERLGKDIYLLLWLNNVSYDENENILSGAFFEVPSELAKWHHVGQIISFDKEDVFDWMVLSFEGKLKGGFTIRENRKYIPENQQEEYDRYIGVTHYE